MAPAIPSGGFTFSNSRDVEAPLLPPLAPLPAPAAGSAAAVVAVVVGVCFGLNGAPTGEPLVDAPSLHDQRAAVMALPHQCTWSPKQLQRGGQVDDTCMRQLQVTSDVAPVLSATAGLQLLRDCPLCNSPRLDSTAQHARRSERLLYALHPRLLRRL